jgi:hypothetical protein
MLRASIARPERLETHIASIATISPGAAGAVGVLGTVGSMMLACATPCTFRLDVGVRDASRLGAAKPADAAVRQCRIDRRSIWQGELIMLENGGKPAVAH